MSFVAAFDTLERSCLVPLTVAVLGYVEVFFLEASDVKSAEITPSVSLLVISFLLEDFCNMHIYFRAVY